MELRKDYILDRYVLISEHRGKRPNDFLVKPDAQQQDAVCFFCPGNESLTPFEKGRVGEPWKIRWFNNKFPALSPEGKSDITTDNNFFTYSDAYGYHEIVVETNSHDKQLYDLTDFEVKELLKVYKSRIEDLSSKPHIKYVLIFKNHGREAGTSLKHSHTQIAALNMIPNFVQEKLDAIKKFTTCPYCEVVNIEKGSFRKCFENNNFVAFAPYASRFNYEIWIFPKKHYLSLTQLDDWELLELSQILKKVLQRLKELNVAYNLFFHNSPQEYVTNNFSSQYNNQNNNQYKGMHFHIEICPRISIFGGFEFGSDIIINTVSPEDAAKFYRGEN